jgi:Fur family peroxide stress response transcriptional regulator
LHFKIRYKATPGSRHPIPFIPVHFESLRKTSCESTAKAWYRPQVLTKYQIRFNLNSMDAEAVKRTLESGGLRCTSQRYGVMAFLMDHPGHPTAAEIFEAVNRLDPRSSRATIYNNLRDLVEAGLVREVAVEGRAARFDAKGLPHHHFICDRCGNVEDIQWYDIPRPASRSLGKRVLRECELIARGLCTRCAPRRASREMS